MQLQPADNTDLTLHILTATLFDCREGLNESFQEALDILVMCRCLARTMASF